MPTIDVARVRDETPGCWRGGTYLNAAGAALMARPVVDAMTAYLQREAEVGGYEAADIEAARLDRLYDAAAELLHCERAEIAVVESATRAWDMAFYALPLSAGDRILTAESEYGSNYLALMHRARRSGATIDVIPSDETGQLSVDTARSMMDERVKLIAITHVPSNGGLVTPAAEIGRIAAEWSIPYLLDACQSAGQMPLDVQAIGCTMAALTSRKFLRGPRGAGLLYVRRDFIERLDPPFVDVHAAALDGVEAYTLQPDAHRFEAWESSHVTRIGLATAIDYALALGLAAIAERVVSLADTLRAQLADVEGITLRDLGRTRCGILSFTVDGASGSDVRRALAARGITISVSSEAAAPIDMHRRGLTSLLRASPHYYNTEEELERFVSAVRSVVRL